MNKYLILRKGAKKTAANFGFLLDAARRPSDTACGGVKKPCPIGEK